VLLRLQFGSSALHLAAAGGHLEVVRALLESGADARATDAGVQAGSVQRTYKTA